VENKSTLKTETEGRRIKSKALAKSGLAKAIPPFLIERGAMQDWDKYSKVAERFQWKVPYQDREDIKQAIILEIAEARARDGDKPFNKAWMYRIASYVVADYWRAEKRRPQAISLNTEIEDGDGNTIELIDTLADDKAIDVDAWLDAKLWLHRYPERLVKIAYKKVAGYPLTKAEQTYLCRERQKAQKRLDLM
jgi:hypothetical protein